MTRLGPWRQTPLAWAMLLCGGLVLGGCSSNPVQQQAKQQVAQQNARAMAQQRGRTALKGTTRSSGGYAPVRSSAQTRAYPQGSGAAPQAALLDSDSLDSLEGLLEATDMEAVEGNRLAILRYGDVWQRIKAGFRMNLAYENSRINAQRNWFSTRQTYLNRLSARASRYLYHTVTEAEKRGIPTELALLPVIESSYDPGATSNAAAAGLWQFIPSTGLIYGLKQTSTYDGRRDVVESTRAAYDYLTSLYNKFGSWELALASYNAGPGRIQQAINRNAAAGLPTDYWSLRLPEETMNYVPRFLAVAQIVQNPDRFGVRLNSIANRPHFRQVALPGVVDLGLVSQITGLTSQEIYELNPAFRYGQTDPEAPGRLLIPNALSADIDDRINRMPTLSGYSALPATPVRTVTLRQPTGISTAEAASLMGNSTAASAVTTRETVSPARPASVAPAVSAATSRPAAMPARVPLPRNAAALAALANAGLTPGGVPKLAVPSSAVINVSTEEPPLSAQETARIQAETIPPATAATGQSVSETIRPAAASPALVAAAQAAVPPVVVAATSPAPSVTVPVVPQSAIDTATTSPVPATELVLTAAEKAQVVAEIQSVAPAGTTVVDPLDGRIKLSAIQTQQSVLEAKGEERKVRYETVEAVKPRSAPARALSMPTPSVTTPKTLTVVTVKAPKPKGERTVYTVQGGDTLTGVARRYGVDPATVADWNQMDRNANLIAGTPLYLYGVKETARPTSYVVQSGDTLTAVAARFDLSPQQLARYNDGLTATSNLIAGDRLQLTEPKDSPARNDSPARSDSRTSAKADSDTYTIQRGDSLHSVAARYGLTVTELARLNGVPSTIELRAGDALNVPANATASRNTSARDTVKDEPRDSKKSTRAPATDSYTVQAGDGLIALAARYGITVEALAELNNTEPTRSLRVGEKLRVPQTESASDSSAMADTGRARSSKTAGKTTRTGSYTIQRGDSLRSVAARYGISHWELAKLNGVPSTASLTAGDSLLLPQDFEKPLDNPADRKPDTQAERKTATKSSARKADQADEPGPSGKTSATDKVASRTERYTVKAGDTLARLAARHELSLAELAELNQIPPQTRLQAGDTLEVPAAAKSKKR